MAYVEMNVRVDHVELGKQGPAATRIIDIRDTFHILVSSGLPWDVTPTLLEWRSQWSWEDIPDGAWA